MAQASADRSRLARALGHADLVNACTGVGTQFQSRRHRRNRAARGCPRASSYYFFMVFVVIRNKTKATAGRALAFIVRIFVDDTIAIAVWTSFHATGVWRSSHVCLCTVSLRHRTFFLSRCSRLEPGTADRAPLEEKPRAKQSSPGLSPWHWRASLPWPGTLISSWLCGGHR